MVVNSAGKQVREQKLPLRGMRAAGGAQALVPEAQLLFRCTGDMYRAGEEEAPFHSQVTVQRQPPVPQQLSLPLTTTFLGKTHTCFLTQQYQTPQTGVPRGMMRSPSRQLPLHPAAHSRSLRRILPQRLDQPTRALPLREHAGTAASACLRAPLSSNGLLTATRAWFAPTDCQHRPHPGCQTLLAARLRDAPSAHNHNMQPQLPSPRAATRP